MKKSIIEVIKVKPRRLYLPMEPPTEACLYYHAWDCSRRIYCPECCSRYTFYADEKEENNE